MRTAEEVIEKLSLIPLEGEGGYFRQSFSDETQVLFPASSRAASSRPASTAIYYLITREQFSALHQLPQTEIFHFYLGSPVEMLQIDANGNLNKFILGQDVLNNQQVQLVVPPKTWQGTRLLQAGNWALMGATVSPGFAYEDMLLADRKRLINQFPQHSEIITQFTRG
jgi:predicted cupin superfamily sugar epimerase